VHVESFSRTIDTMRTLSACPFIVSTCLLLACGSETEPRKWQGPTATGDGGAGGGMSTGAGGSGGWQPLIEQSWEVDSGSEAYKCALTTMMEDTYINGFRALSPEGTHHTIAAIINTPSEPDGAYDCNSTEIGHSMMFTSGVGTTDLVLPPGVAMLVPGGSQVLLNLHLFNTSDEPLSGVSGTLVQTIDASEVTAEAEVVLAGTLSISLDPQAEGTASGGCTFDQPATVVSLWPHMHQLGTHMVVEHNGTVLHDAPYSFDEQVGYDIDPLLVDSGESIDVSCTYDNTTSDMVSFGESSTSEMCFVGLYRYPASGNSICVN